MTAQQLKNAILQEAIQGRLVPQDPNDEPASVLLEKIRAEKKRLVKEGKLKKKELEEKPISEDEIPFEIPESWEWVRLENITTYISRGKSPVYSEIQKYPIVAQKCNQWSGFSLEKAKFADPKTVEKYTEERLLRDGDLLWNSTGLGTLGRMAIYDSNVNQYGWAAADSHVTVIRTLPEFSNYQYLYYYFASNEVQSVIEDKSDGSTKQKELSQETVRKYLVPLPPLAEQKRIVAKIEQLLPKVEEYGKAQEKLNKLNEELPARLKKSILQEAIEGRLVPQDPNDEPASVLLDKIREEKKQLVKEGKLKKKELEEKPISEDEIPFEIPESWEWVRLENITTYISRGKSPVYSEIQKYPIVAQKCNQWSGFSLEKAKFADPKTVEKYTEERLLRDGDLLWNSTGLGTLGRMAIYDSNVNQYGWAAADSHVTVIRTLPEFSNYQYLYYYFASNEVQSVIEDKSDGSTKQKELSQETVRKYLVPLPPLTEQHRIVAKIEQLLGEINKLNA